MYMSFCKNFWQKLMKNFRDEYVSLKRQGAQMRIHRKLRLKKLRVTISTRESMPSGPSPQNSQTNFIDLLHSVHNFKTRENFSEIHVTKRAT
jgi:hypothetical protein